MQQRVNGRVGFTLVELSIVLVILGLLVGGVLTGQSLIRAAELRAATTEYNRYVTAVQTFRDKYFAIPGDMANATAYWGKDNASCSGDSGTAATPGSCNGNGDGTVNDAAGQNVTGEMFRFWQHLALAGMIEGSYTGLSGPSAVSVRDTIPGTNGPKSRIGNGGWGVRYILNYAGDTSTPAYNFQNFFTLGARVVGDFPYGVIFKPEEAYNIDMKMDDGKPMTGKLIGMFWNTCSTAGSNSDRAATYRLDNTAVACSLYFPNAF